MLSELVQRNYQTDDDRTYSGDQIKFRKRVSAIAVVAIVEYDNWRKNRAGGGRSFLFFFEISMQLCELQMKKRGALICDAR